LLQAIVSGLVSGGVYAVLGICVVILYQTVGVLNFAQAAVGGFGTFVTVVIAEGGTPLGLAVAVGVLAGVTLGGLNGLVMVRWFAEAGAEVRSTVAIGVLVTIVTAGFRIFGDSPRQVPDISPDVSLDVGGVTVTGGGLTAIAGALAVAAIVTWVLRRTDVGLRLRALAERPRTAELLGIPAARMAVAVWGLMGALSVLAVLVVAPARTPDLLSLTLLVVPAMAAGLMASFASLWGTVAGGLALGLLQGACGDLGGVAPYRDALPFLVIVLALGWSQRGKVWDEAR
jgi:branched-chain amino acid transport system permease protein